MRLFGLGYTKGMLVSIYLNQVKVENPTLKQGPNISWDSGPGLHKNENARRAQASIATFLLTVTQWEQLLQTLATLTSQP